MGFASPSLTKGWDLPPRARRPSCETRPRLGKNLSLARARGADSSAFLASHILRTNQRDGRDAVGLRLPKPSAAVSRLSRACRKTAPLPEHRFATRYRSGDIRSVFRLRRASRPVWDIAPHSRGGRAEPALAVALTNCRALSVKPRCEDKRIFRGRSSGLVSRSRNEAGFARVGGGRGAEMPRSLLDSVKNGRSFAASASRDRFAHCPSGRLRRWPSASRYFGFAYGEVSLAPLLGHRFATRYRSGDTRSAHFPSPLSQTNQLML